MKLNKVKIAVLAAVAIIGLLAIPVLAACPPGTIDITTLTGYNTNATVTITAAGTYCVPGTGATLATTHQIVVAASNVTIVGENPYATLTGSTGGTSAIIKVNAGMTGVVIHNFTLKSGAGTNDGIDAAGTVIEGMTFDDGTTGFNNYAVQLSGTNPIVQNNTFNMTNSTGAAAINLKGGSGAHIIDNILTAAGGKPGKFVTVDAGLTTYNGATISGNRVDGVVGEFIGSSFTNSTISGNTATTNTNGIDLGGTTTNTTVSGNNITYGSSGTGDGILDAGGSNNKYVNNTLTAAAGTAATSGVVFQSTNAVISGNRITAGTTGDGINAGTNASNAQIKNNTIYSAGGAGISLTDGTNTNFQITGNSINHVSGTGIDAGFGSNHTISGNTLTNVALGGSGVVGIKSPGNSTITNNTLTGVKGVGIYSNGANDVITGNQLTNINSHGIQAHGSNTTIQGNTIQNVNGSDGILLNANNQTVTGNTITGVVKGFGINVGAQSNNTITGNTIKSTAQSGIEVAGGDNNQIKNNTLTNVATKAQNASGFYWAGIRIAAVQTPTNTADNNVVDHNTITNAGGADYAVGIDVGTFGKSNDNNKITNNTVSGFTTVSPSAAYSEGIRVLSGQNNTVVGNTVKNSGNMQFGIDIRTVKQVPITGNTVEGMKKAGLYLWGGTASTPLLVTGNTFTGNVKGIWMVAGAANIGGTTAATKNTIKGGVTALYVDPSANAATFKVNGNCINAPILARNDGIGTLNATGNYWAATPQTGVNVFGSVDFSGALASCPGSPVPPTGKSHTYGATAGWYMVSVPTTGNAASLFGTTLYTYSPSAGNYVVATSLVPSKGYWAFLPASKAITATGTQVTSDVTISLPVAGWYQISAPWSYPKSAIKVTKGGVTKSWADAVSAGWVRDQIYGYTATGGAYTTPTTMNPWYGYWVKANVSGLTLTLLAASGTPVSASSVSTMSAPTTVTPLGLPPLPPTPQAIASQLVFGNWPNPVTEVHTTTFEVKGAAAGLVEAIKVEIYDLSGRLVYSSGEVAGTSVDWHTENDYGEYLANGVYLYKMYAKVAGQWVVSSVKKVVILR